VETIGVTIGQRLFLRHLGHVFGITIARRLCLRLSVTIITALRFTLFTNAHFVTASLKPWEIGDRDSIVGLLQLFLTSRASPNPYSYSHCLSASLWVYTGLLSDKTLHHQTAGKCYYQWRAHWYRNLLPVRRPLIWNSITSGGTILV